MEAGPRYLEGTTVGSGRDIIGVRRDRIADIISTGREIIARAKSEKLLPETITGSTAALLVTIAGYGEPLSEGQWRELAGVVGDHAGQHICGPGPPSDVDNTGAVLERGSQPGVRPLHPTAGRWSLGVRARAQARRPAGRVTSSFA